MALNVDVVGEIGRRDAGLYHRRVLRADRILQRRGRELVRIGTLNHLVRVHSLVARHIDRQRVVPEGLHLIDRQVAVRLIRQHRIFTCKRTGRTEANGEGLLHADETLC